MAHCHGNRRRPDVVPGRRLTQQWRQLCSTWRGQRFRLGGDKTIGRVGGPRFGLAVSRLADDCFERIIECRIGEAKAALDRGLRRHALTAEQEFLGKCTHQQSQRSGGRRQNRRASKRAPERRDELRVTHRRGAVPLIGPVKFDIAMAWTIRRTMSSRWIQLIQ